MCVAVAATPALYALTRASRNGVGWWLLLSVTTDFVVLLCSRRAIALRKVAIPISERDPDGWATATAADLHSIAQRRDLLIEFDFEQLPGPCRIGDRVVIERFVHTNARTAASITAMSDPSGELTEFSTSLNQGAGSLSTSNTFGLPPVPWQLRQGLRDMPATELWAMHLEGLRWLADRGIDTDDVNPGSFPEHDLQGSRENLVKFLHQPLRSGAIMEVVQARRLSRLFVYPQRR